MSLARWALWTLAALVALSVVPFRREGALAAVRWSLMAIAAGLFAIWLVTGWLAIWRAVVQSSGRSWLARVIGVAGGLVPWLLAAGLFAVRRADVRAVPPAVTPEREAAAARIEQRVRHLATDIGERHAVGRDKELERAANWIAAEFETAGWPVRWETFEVPVGDRTARVANVVAERAGRTRPEEIVLVGAHYDTAPGTPGANDNASGVAALLELAYRWRELDSDRTLRLVAFTNEEPPFFMTGYMGSEVHAAGVMARRERVLLMMSLETIGGFLYESGTQMYPSPLFHLMFPDRGHFIALVGGVRSAAMLRSVAAAMRRATDVPVRWASVPLWVSGAAWSDHWPLARRGIPAFMVTDTAPFRYRWYHEPEDLPEHLHYNEMAAVVDGVEAAVRAHVGGTAPSGRCESPR